MNKISTSMVGCWLDGAMGWHNNYRVVDLACERGFEIDKDEQLLLDVYRHGGDLEKVVGMLVASKLSQPVAPRGQEVPYSMAAAEAEARELMEAASAAVSDQGGLVDRATEYLESLAPEGYSFTWDMGELSLLCLCQIEGAEENKALGKTHKDRCASCESGRV